MIKLLSFFTIILFSACSAVKPIIPPKIINNTPDYRAVTNLTDFSEALVCMDELLLNAKVSPIVISSENINNLTSTASFSKGGKEMLINALSKMSAKSNSIIYVRYGPDISSILDLQGAHPDNAEFKAPDYFIAGAVTEYNQDLCRGSTGSAGSVEIDSGETTASGLVAIVSGQEEGTLSYSNNMSYGTITLDMSLGYIKNLQIIPGTVSSNTLALKVSRSKSISADLTLGDVGTTYSISDTSKLDVNTIMRSLIEIGSVEIIGKIHQVPYWDCLNSVYDKSGRLMELSSLYGNLELNNKTTEFATFALMELKYLNDNEYRDALEKSDTKKMNLLVSTALTKFQINNQLMTSGLIDFQTFRFIYETLESNELLSNFNDYLLK